MTDIFLEVHRQTDQREARLLRLAFAFLFLTALSIALAPAARLRDWYELGVRWQHLTVLPVWGACAWLVRRVLRRRKPDRDPYLLPVALLLTGWGMLLVWRLAPEFGARQTGWLMVGTVALIEILRGPSDLRWLRRYRYLWLMGGILLTALTLLFGTNPSGGDPRLWLGCCGFYLQPSEPLRLLLIAFVATYLSDRLAIDWAARRPEIVSTLSPLLAVWGLSVLLLIVQRDLGTGLLFLALLAVLLYLASGRVIVLAAGGAFAAVGGAIGFLTIEVVRLRIQTWLNPWIDPIGSSYQIIQSLIAIASGGVFGRGPGLGSPGFVPVAHTDFVFAAVTEEWGLLGALAMIGLFALLVTRGLRIAARGRNPFTVFLSAGLAAAYGLQTFLIIGGVLRLAPLTGVTLPFVSYGGSSLLTSFIGLALLLHVSGEDGQAPGFQRPIRNVQAGFSFLWILLALVLGWWTLYRSPVLVDRTDNPRRGLAQRFSLRGSIVDRRGTTLAESVGDPGSYQRVYPEPLAAPVVGYDSIFYGQSGMELSMDGFLRGEEGNQAWRVALDKLLNGSPPPGLDVRLTLDLTLQSEAMRALGGRQGAVVVLDGEAGDVLALASSPAFDPNQLEAQWVELTQSRSAPLLNRATQASYQPGTALSAFVLAWAHGMGMAASSETAPGMFEPVLIDGESLSCAGEASPYDERTYALAARLGCPAPFAKLGSLLGPVSLDEMTRSFGLESPLNLRLPAAPLAARTLAEGGEPSLWAIGQGGVTVTPVQMARALAALMNDGLAPPLHLVDAVRRAGGSWERLPPLNSATRFIAPAALHDFVPFLEVEEGRVELLGQAITGTDGVELAWYLGAIRSPDGLTLVVVVLEDDTPSAAADVGRDVLAPSSAP